MGMKACQEMTRWLEKARSQSKSDVPLENMQFASHIGVISGKDIVKRVEQVENIHRQWGNGTMISALTEAMGQEPKFLEEEPDDGDKGDGA